MRKTADSVRGPHVWLGMQNDLYLVVFAPSGVHYSNQTGGYSCDQRAAEGFLVPLGHSARRVWGDIQEYVSNKHGSSGANFDVDDAVALDAILASCSASKMLSLDRKRIRESQEAWVYVEIGSHSDVWDRNDAPSNAQVFFGIGAARGVLTWQNSD